MPNFTITKIIKLFWRRCGSLLLGRKLSFPSSSVPDSRISDRMMSFVFHFQLLKGNPSPQDTLRFVFDRYGIIEEQRINIRFLDESGRDVLDAKIDTNTLVVETDGPLGNVRPFRVVVDGYDARSKLASSNTMFVYLFNEN